MNPYKPPTRNIERASPKPKCDWWRHIFSGGTAGLIGPSFFGSIACFAEPLRRSVWILTAAPVIGFSAGLAFYYFVTRPIGNEFAERRRLREHPPQNE
ncbi:MAG TPA: hypothetical protein DDW52_26160 [Planctomycetaceae bacterium]|nr:hypothetical protein [Planctomycetaceae bacterium]